MTGFTKGPWRVEADGYKVGSEGGFEPFGACGCCNSPWMNGETNAEEKANAHLIAAAPDLYVALEAILNAGSFHLSAIEIDTHAPNYKDGEQLEAQARAAMAKARGE